MTERKDARESWENVPQAKPADVIEALARVMTELPAIGKDKKADPSMGGYSYRGIEDITSACQPLFGKYGVVFAPHVLNWEIRDIVVNGKPWTDTILEVRYDVWGPGPKDDMVSVGPFIGIGRDNSDKGANKALTQAYKYALLQVLCIADKKDDADSQSYEADAVSQPDPEAEAAMHDLTDAIHKWPEAERPLIRAHLREKFGPSSHMDLEAIHAAKTVVVNWPPPT